MENNNQTFKSYFEAVKFLESFIGLPPQKNYLHNRSHSEIYIKRMKYFLRILGNPQKSFKYIHITGTAGKGSVAIMLQEILFSNGYKTGLFTSPFCTASIEKIRVNRKYISPAEFVKIVNYLKPYIKKAQVEGPYGRPSYFELFFAMALLYFIKKRCKWVVCEVGLGGRYDATNVIEHPKVTAITNINFDHTNVLGKTLRKIANDKAGIIKTDTSFFTTERRPRVLKIFRTTCREKQAIINIIPNICRDVAYKQRGMFFRIDGIKKYLFTPLLGEHQLSNISLAVSISRYLKIKTKSIIIGLHHALLPCRFEIIQDKPLIILDGAHNPVKMKSVVSNIKKLQFERLFIILSIAQDKDINGILRLIIPYADNIFITRFKITDRLACPPNKILTIAKKYQRSNARFFIYEEPKVALEYAIKQAWPNDLILVTGSFFLAGDLRKRWYSEKFILANLRSF